MLNTKRLLLRVMQTDDAIALQKMLSDPVGMHFTGGLEGPITRTIEETNQNIISSASRFTTDWRVIASKKGHAMFAVILKETYQFIGRCGLDYLREIDKVELRYEFLREYWGKGYGTEAAKAIVQYAFYEMEIPELYAAVHPENIASERILKRIGMIYLKKIDWSDNKQVHIYSLSNPSILNER